MRARGDRPRAIVDRIQAAVSRARESRLAVALVVLTVVAAGAAGALVTVDFRPDPYTKLEFVDELRVSPEGEFTATVAVENHEGRATTYTLLVVGQRAIRAGEGVRIERTRRFAARSRSLPAGERWRVCPSRDPSRTGRPASPSTCTSTGLRPRARPMRDCTRGCHATVRPRRPHDDARQLRCWCLSVGDDGRGAAGDERGAVVRNGRRGNH